MPLVEIYENEDDPPLFAGDFEFVPRVGETISRDAGGYFKYYEVLEVWHRQDFEAGNFQTCVAVKLND